MRKPKTSCTGGFTLIELLVVMAIIALLATLIVPSARMAVSWAQQVKCQTNLRGQANAHSLYAGENNRSKPPHVWRRGKRVSYFLAAVNVKMGHQPIGQGILVAEGYLPLRMILCPASSMSEDRDIDEEAWANSSISGSSYSYFWRHSSTVRNDADLLTGFRYLDSQAEGRFGLTMDFNAAAGHTYIGAYGSGDWYSHPLLGLVNISYSDGAVRSEDNSKITLQAPFGRTARMEWWKLAHEAH